MLNRYIYKLITWMLAISIVFSLYKKDDENIFSDNELVLSEDEADDLLDELEEEIGTDIPSSAEEDYLLLTAIMNNEDISDEDKKIFYSLIYIILDNPYLNKEEVYDKWSYLKIYYPDETKGNIGGEYHAMANYINFYTDLELVKRHEGIHSMTSNIKSIRHYSRSIVEGVTQLLNLEYYSEYPFIDDTSNYGYEIAYVKMLCDIIGSDKVLEAYSTHDFALIAKSLAEINGTYEEAKKVMTILEDSLEKFHEIGEIGYLAPSYTMEEIEDALDRLDLYIQNSGANQDTMNSYWYNRNLFINMYKYDAYNEYYNFFVENGVLEKAYFSESLKEKYPTSTIEEWSIKHSYCLKKN